MANLIKRSERMRKKNLILSSLLLSSAMLSACTPNVKEVHNTEIVQEITKSPNKVDSVSISETEAEEMESKDIINKNSLELLKAVSKDNTKNHMVSDYSLELALGLVALGMEDNDTYQSLCQYIGIDPSGDVYSQLKNIMDKDNKEIVEIAFGVWSASDIAKIKEAYKEKIDLLGAKSGEYISSDVNSRENACNEINQYVNEKTHGLIQRAVESLSSDETAILLNTLYFKSNWMGGPLSIETREFRNSKGEKREVPFIKKNYVSYFDTKDYVGGILQFDSNYEFIAIMNKDENNDVYDYSNIDIDKLLEKRTQEVKGYDGVSLYIPKFEFDSNYDLSSYIQNIGLEKLFTDSTLLSNMFNGNNVISKVNQKTKIKLDENGTEAAAVTTLDVRVTSAQIYNKPKYKELLFNRPFVFIIRNTESGKILFSGQVNIIDS